MGWDNAIRQTRVLLYAPSHRQDSYLMGRDNRQTMGLPQEAI